MTQMHNRKTTVVRHQLVRWETTVIMTGGESCNMQGREQCRHEALKQGTTGIKHVRLETIDMKHTR